MFAEVAAAVIQGLAWITLGWLLVRLGVALVNALGRVHLPPAPGGAQRTISVLIPARNEARLIGGLLQRVLAMGPAVMEVLVYDDGSTDATWEIVSRMQGEDPRLRGIRGGPLPGGWLGENHACHHLAREARGDYLLFLDADVIPGPTLARDLIDRAVSRNLDLLSLFPVQVMESQGERRIVSLMNWILLSLLPLPAVARSRRPSLAAANGQCMLFAAETYRHNTWHALVRQEAVEDIQIARSMKRRGYRIETLLSDGQIACRMYTGYDEALQGFARNIHHYFGGNYWTMALFGILTTTGPFWALAFMGWMGFGAYLAGALMLRWVTAHTSRQPASKQVLWHPLLHLGMLQVMMKAWNSGRKGSLLWKGRTLGEGLNGNP